MAGGSGGLFLVPLWHCVTLGKSPPLSGLQFPHLCYERLELEEFSISNQC